MHPSSQADGVYKHFLKGLEGAPTASSHYGRASTARLPDSRRSARRGHSVHTCPPRCVFLWTSPRLATLQASEPPSPRPTAEAVPPLRPSLSRVPRHCRPSPPEPLLGEQSRRAAKRAASLPTPRRQDPKLRPRHAPSPDSRIHGSAAGRGSGRNSGPPTQEHARHSCGGPERRGRGGGDAVCAPPAQSCGGSREVPAARCGGPGFLGSAGSGGDAERQIVFAAPGHGG